MPLSENALVDWQTVKEYLEIPDDDDQTFVERLINMASARANKVTERQLAARDYDIQLNGPGPRRRDARFDAREEEKLILPQWPIRSLTSIHGDTARNFGAETEVPAEAYDYDPDIGVVAFDRRLPHGFRVVRVVYNAGYDRTAGEVPEDLEYAVVETVAWNMSRLRGGSIGIKSKTNPDGYEQSLEMTLPVNAQRVFEEYKRERY